MDNHAFTCEICGTSISVDEEYYSVKVQLEKMDRNMKVFRGEEFPLYSVCSACAGDVLLKGMVLGKNNTVSLSSDDSVEK